MKKISIFTVALLLVFASATFVMAGQKGKGAGMGGGRWMNASTFSCLDLTTEQSEKIRALRETHLKEMAPLRTQLHTKRAELRLLWLQTNPDPAKIKVLQKEILGLRGQVQDKTTDHWLEFRNILTPEQLTKLLAQGLGKGHHGPRWGKGGGRGQGMGQGACW